MITIFDIYNDGITGTNTSMVDLYFYLQTKNIKVNMLWKKYDYIDFREVMNVIKNNFQNPPNKFLTKFVEDVVNSEIIFTTFYNLHRLKDLNVKLVCNKLIIFDTTGLTLYNYNNDYDFISNIDSKEIILLANPSNDIKLDFVNFNLEFYHKFSLERLSFLEENYKPINKILTSKLNVNEETECHLVQFKKYFKGGDKQLYNFNFSYLEKDYSDKLPHGCISYEYERWFEITPNIFVENIGKLIFEFCYLDKQVFYSSKNKTIKDGLHYYLKLLDIDDSFSQTINLSKEDIKEKLLYKDNETILELL